jgi:hypothetical protein
LEVGRGERMVRWVGMSWSRERFWVGAEASGAVWGGLVVRVGGEFGAVGVGRLMTAASRMWGAGRTCSISTGSDAADLELAVAAAG